MVKLIARVFAKPGKGEVIASALAELAVPSRAEVGCILYDVCRSRSNPDEVLVLEEWESQEALDEHMVTPHFCTFGAKIRDAVAGEPELTFLERV